MKFFHSDQDENIPSFVMKDVCFENTIHSIYESRDNNYISENVRQFLHLKQKKKSNIAQFLPIE